MMLSIKENYLMAFRDHKKPEFIPKSSDVAKAGGAFEIWENGPRGGGYDEFGVLWSASESAMGAGVPAAGHTVLEDICDWEDIVKFPDLDKIDWKAYAEPQIAGLNRDEKLLEYGCWNGQFLRTTHLMGFENALCAMITDEEAYSALLTAITDYRIKSLERIHEYFRPDIITLYIDVATERGLFMSREMYQKLISPQQKRFADAVKSYGMMACVHNCGKCDEIIPDFIDEGFTCWCSAQPSNDIEAILKTYGDRIAVHGGYDSNGIAGRAEASDEEIDQEVKRCLETYAPHGSYIFCGIRMVPGAPKEVAVGSINRAFDKYKDLYK